MVADAGLDADEAATAFWSRSAQLCRQRQVGQAVAVVGKKLALPSQQGRTALRRWPTFDVRPVSTKVIFRSGCPFPSAQLCRFRQNEIVREQSL